MKIPVYILYAKWDNLDNDGSEVIGVSDKLDPLANQLKQIAASKKGKYVKMEGSFYEESDTLHYERTSITGKYEKFYISKKILELSDTTMYAIHREIDKINYLNDIGQHLDDMYEFEEIEAWKYEYMTKCPDMKEHLLRCLESKEDCNVAYNDTIENVIATAVQELSLDDKKLEFLWEELGNILVDDDGNILSKFLGFESGTHREEVWKWFDERYTGGVAKLMFH